MVEFSDGGPAFPIHPGGCWHPGMSLRDYFAAQALVGLLSGSGNPHVDDGFATAAYRIADAMLAGRKRQP